MNLSNENARKAVTTLIVSNDTEEKAKAVKFINCYIDAVEVLTKAIDDLSKKIKEGR